MLAIDKRRTLQQEMRRFIALDQVEPTTKRCDGDDRREHDKSKTQQGQAGQNETFQSVTTNNQAAKRRPSWCNVQRRLLTLDFSFRQAELKGVAACFTK